ncbi:MAG TPA: hypothetical protein VJP02_01415 [Candidatus Sulfotelmatobacter sp.]|nr:hypothetical protein [Candidatus Sulfotelmatobacter sp.]
MNADFRHMKHHARLRVSTMIVLVLLLSSALVAADNSPQVTLDARKTSPRAVEALTQRAIVRDYRFAWTNLDAALESNSIGLLNGLFAGTANDWLRETVTSQQLNGMTSRYLNQRHKLEAIFYAPVGDVIELHDTAEYDFEIHDGGKTIHNEHATVHYVVLMTPGADRWVIRQLQAVPQF